MNARESWVVIAPHPDDETLGCGGTLLKAKSRGDEIHWVIMTALPEGVDVGGVSRSSRAGEIAEVTRAYSFDSVHQLDRPTTTLDALPRGELIADLAAVLSTVKPSRVLLPWHADAHSDHRVTFLAAQACLKPFRAPWLRTVWAYETLSETGFALDEGFAPFVPSAYVDTSEFETRKCQIMEIYSGQMADHPFPRSLRSIHAQLTLRGAQANALSAEAFVQLFSLA